MTSERKSTERRKHGLANAILRALSPACCVLWLAGHALAADSVAPIWDVDTRHLFDRVPLTWGRDPFFKKPGFADAGQDSRPALSLEAILLDGPDEEPEALINDQVVRVGDSIDGRMVDEIGVNYVLIADGESLIELNVPDFVPPKGSIEFNRAPARADEEFR